MAERLKLPLQPPIEPMLAEIARGMPDGEGWLYEPKWDGFRALVFWDGEQLYIQSRDLKPLNRYFPELEAGLRKALEGKPCVLDGEIVIAGKNGLDFEALGQRIHPAESRINMLAKETPAEFVAFDLLATVSDDLAQKSQQERRTALEKLLGKPIDPLHLTPCTTDRTTANDWFERFEGAGLDGVIAKRVEETYQPGARVMLKVKHQRTVDCVVSGFRYHKSGKDAVGSLLLGLFDDQGVLHYVGGTSSFKMSERKDLIGFLEPYRGDTGFGHGRTPGEPNRWNSSKDTSWEPLKPELVCEVAFDHLQSARFRHGATFLRWRPDKPARACTYDQVDEVVPAEAERALRRVTIWVGTSGYQYPEWRGSFYPERYPESQMLAFYTRHFDTVEINYTSYQFPTEKSIAGWLSGAPDGFKYAPKVPRKVTYGPAALKAAGPMNMFLSRIGGLGDKLGPVLMQLPPGFARDDSVLDALVSAVPPGTNMHIELRDPSWHHDHVFETLRTHGVGLCISDSEELVTPVAFTSDVAYFRLRHEGYQPADLERWAEAVRSRHAESGHDVFAYFKHEGTGSGPRFARELKRLLGLPLADG